VERPVYDFSLREALSSLTFWMLILANGARSVAMTSIIIHQVVYLTEVRNIPLVQAGAALGAMVTVSLIGRISFGFMGDRIDKRYLLIVTYLLQAVGIYILMGVTSMPRLWLFVVLYGIAYGGAIPISMAIVGEYFGRLRYATIRGFMQLFLMPATVVGPIYAGWVYDTTNNYQIAFTSFIGALLVGTVFVFLARRPRPPRALAQTSR
jgi:MFS family permease